MLKADKCYMHHCLIQVVKIKVNISEHFHDMQWRDGVVL